MTFTARIRRTSPVWRHWIEQHLKRASLCAVPFVRTATNDFVFDGQELTADQVAVMRGNPCVDLEVHGNLTEMTIVGDSIVASYPHATVAPEAAMDEIETLNALDAVKFGMIGVLDTNMGEAKEPNVYIQPRHPSRDNRHQRRGR